MELACGELGVAVEEFWNMTMRELINVVHGARAKQKVEYENGWSQTRYIAYYSMVPHLKNPPPMKDMLPLPWDINPAIKWESSRERYDELVKKWCKN